FGEGFAAKGIRDHQPVITIVEPTRAEIFRRREESNADSAIADHPGVIAPRRSLTPRSFRAAQTFAREDCATVFLRERRGHADAEPHLLLVSEVEVIDGRRYGRAPGD